MAGFYINEDNLGSISWGDLYLYLFGYGPTLAWRTDAFGGGPYVGWRAGAVTHYWSFDSGHEVL